MDKLVLQLCLAFWGARRETKGSTHDLQAKSVTVSELLRKVTPEVPLWPLLAPKEAKPCCVVYARSSYLIPATTRQCLPFSTRQIIAAR